LRLFTHTVIVYAHLSIILIGMKMLLKTVKKCGIINYKKTILEI